jgi:predicted nucleic acid-binding Zn ribbon protein
MLGFSPWPFDSIMPTYVYEYLDGNGDPFEIVQSIREQPLEKHPESGRPIRRVIQAPFIGGAWSESAMKKNVSDDKKLDRLGFTKYVKAGNGIYEKRAGKGPDIISKDAPISGDSLGHLD